ncbi:TonB-dependent receptor [Mangrovimonas sp. CR14]|uniref:TonB-dependent receptor n=1 Tax=Mangrovimonas sp. CR14 TaxID=2706120 RepID=UPI00142028BE|nr:TonB-dependent receptor [Mangrovimonas sp. CR14]NIK92352.1 TonB-dependent receptor [Mangrovimonas sp. CR14]
MRKHIQILYIFLFVTVGSLWAQDKDNDTLQTGVINVVKPYTPSISDAFKVRETPNLDDDVNTTKKEVQYNILSVPVASTFTPAKGKAATLEKTTPAKLFDNYATLAGGSYTTLVGDVYLNYALSRTDHVGASVSHHSSQTGIDEALLDHYFYDSKIDLNYSRYLRDLTWNVDAGFIHQVYNWYGLPQPFFTPLSEQSSLGVSHTFYGGNIGGDIGFEDGYIKTAKVLLRHFGDNNGSGENRFNAKVSGDVTIGEAAITADIMFDYVGGSFDRNYWTSDEIKYGNFNIGLAPSYRLIQDDLTLDLGVSTYYLNDFENGGNKFYIYPNIEASYRIVNEVLIAYGGIKGGLIQNSYYDFAQENPFISPTLNIMPTDQQYNAYVGLRGKVSNTMSYTISGGYMADRGKALFKSNEVLVVGAEEVYQNGNSFNVVYDDVNTFNIGGELSVDLNRNITVGVKADYFIYGTDDQTEAWNLPNFKGSLFGDFQIDEHWFAGASMFFVGERKDELVFANSLVPMESSVVSLDGYFDLNLHAGYHINDRWSVFLKGNNLASQNYQRWMNFPVQGIQVLGGVTYKFNF